MSYSVIGTDRTSAGFNRLVSAIVASAVIAAVSSLPYTSRAQGLQPQYRRIYQQAQQWNDRPSMSTAIVSFELIAIPYHVAPKITNCCKPMPFPDFAGEARDIGYRVPRNYLVWMDHWDGGRQTLVTFKVTFPGFTPLTDADKSCMNSAPLYRPPGCIPIESNVRRGSASDPPDDVRFENARSLFHSQRPKAGPYGFELYETGPANARIITYRKKTPSHTLIIQCFRQSGEALSVCSTESRLKSGNVLEYLLYDNELKHAVEIDEGIRGLITGFESEP